MSIYHSNWNPRGVRKDYDRCAVGAADALRIFGEFAGGKIVDACGWFDAAGRLRILVADTDTGRRLIARTTKRNWSISINHRNERHALAQEPSR